MILSNPRGLEPQRSENWADGRGWRDGRGWKLGKLGKLERLGQLEDLNLEDWVYGSPDHLSAGDLERQPAEGGKRVFLAAFPRWRAGSRECASCCLPPETLLVGRASQDWAPSPVSGEATLEPGSLDFPHPSPWGRSQEPKAIGSQASLLSPSPF